jgi:hypothetical protein
MRRGNSINFVVKIVERKLSLFNMLGDLLWGSSFHHMRLVQAFHVLTREGVAVGVTLGYFMALHLGCPNVSGHRFEHMGS